MAVVRWGIIGCGDVTEVKSGPGFSAARSSTLQAVMRRTPGKAEDYARRHHVPRWSVDAEDIITAPDIDAVYVATYPDSHLEYAVRCAEAGKAVYVEKPMSLSYEQSQRMIDHCATARVPLWVGYYRRALPRFLAVKELLDEGAIGAVRGVQTVLYSPLPAPTGGTLPWRLDPTITPGGQFFDVACHFFDLADFLLGPVVAAQGGASNQANAYPVPDTVAATFQFASGVAGSGLWCFGADDHDDLTTVVGEKGRVTFPVLGQGAIAISRGGQVEQRTIADPACVHQPLIQTIVDELNGEGSCPSTGESAARTSWVMDQILGSGA